MLWVSIKKKDFWLRDVCILFEVYFSIVKINEGKSDKE